MFILSNEWRWEGYCTVTDSMCFCVFQSLTCISLHAPQTFLQLLGGSDSLVESHTRSNHSHMVIVGFVHDLRWKENSLLTRSKEDLGQLRR